MKLSIFAALSLSAMAFNASAQSSYLPTEHQPSFDFVQVGYQSYNLDGLSDDLTGFALQGSVSVTDQIFADVRYEDVSVSSSFQQFRVGADLRQLFANIGYQFYQQGNMSIYAAGGLAWSEVELSESGPNDGFRVSESDTGFNLMLGMRYRLTEQLEFDAAVRHVDIADGSDQVLTLAGRYYFTPRFSLDARYTRVDSDLSGYTIGASYHF